MHSALLVATIPPETQDWHEFVEYVGNKLLRDESCVQLAENVWLLNVEKSLAPLGWLVAMAEQKGVSYGLLAFERAPAWLPAGFDPKPIQARSVL